MRYAAKIALRHLLATPGQTALLVLGVAIGVSVFIFMSALIGGLATLLTLRTVGSIPHVVLEMPEREPLILPGLGVQELGQRGVEVPVVGLGFAFGGDEAERIIQVGRGRDQIRADFDSGDLVDVDGWQFSRTEARLAALISLEA